MRVKIGHDPIRVPTREEMDSETDTSELYPEWHKTQWKLFGEPELLIQSLDEPFSPIAKAVARNQSLEPTSEDIDEAGTARTEQEIALEKEKTKAKIAVVKARPKTTTRPSKPKRVSIKNGYLENTFIEMKQDVVQHIAHEQKMDHSWIVALMRTQMQTTIDRLKSEQVLAFKKGYQKHAKLDDVFRIDLTIARATFNQRAEKYILRLLDHLSLALKRNITDDMSVSEMTSKTRAIFDSLHYRTKFIEDVELRKAYNLGFVIGAKNAQVQSLYTITTSDSACEECTIHHKQAVNFNLIDIEDLPPYHAHCECMLVKEIPVLMNTQDATQGTADDPTGVVKETEFRPCPKCSKTAVRTKNTGNTYNCKACGHAFTEEEESKKESNDGKLKTPKGTRRAKFEKCIMRTMTRLRSEHTDWDEDKIRMLAETACDHLLQNSQESDDGEKLEGDSKNE